MNLTPQMVELVMARIAPPAHPYAEDPVGFARDVLGFDTWSKQVQIMESVRDHPKTAVRSCHGVGKTATTAAIVLWFLATRPNSRVITTAPTWFQVEQLLWREIRTRVATANAQNGPPPFPPCLSTKLEFGDLWFAIGLSTDRPERFQGHHADNLLLVVDEASGVAEAIYEASEGFQTAEGARVLLVGNPTMVGNTFYRAFTRDAEHWSRIHISALDAPNETGEQVPAHVARAMPRKGWAEEKRREWGADSVIYKVRVLGEFAANLDAVMPLGDVEAAQARTVAVREGLDHAVIACDVARFGDDETVIALRVGARVRIVERFVGKPTTHTASRVMHHAAPFNELMRTIVVDDAGVGGGVTDQLRAGGFPTVAFNGAHKARRPDDFPNRRSEVWFEAAAMLEDIDLDPDDQLAADLTAPEYSFDLKQRRVVESKDTTKRRLGRSPDRADAVCMALSMECPSPEESARLQRLRHEAPASRAITAGLLSEPL